jgi:hypothetical protein
METLSGFPFWEIEFDAEGQLARAADGDRIAREIAAQGITDLFIFSHGWNNDRRAARSLYERFFGATRDVLAVRATRAGVTIGIAGVIWPSILFPDDAPSGQAGGLASLGATDAGGDAIEELRKVFPNQGPALDQLQTLLEAQPSDPEALKTFQRLLGALAPSSRTDEGVDDEALLREPPERVFEWMSELAPAGARVATAGIGDRFQQLWTGAREALRATSYWTMKERAGHVGERGVGPFIGRVRHEAQAIRVHLVGHSFGARVVSFSLKGLQPTDVGPASPVKSLTLLQGAFSHFAFASELPHDRTRGGALAGMAARVDGPILVTHSEHDLAVFVRYPQASFIARQDAAATSDTRYRYGGMGGIGAQAVNAKGESIREIGHPYGFSSGTFLNLDGNQVITAGEPPSGAHSDIFHPEIAWAVVCASNVAAKN